MAEFKLGRIRFVWKNEWASSTTYYKDDVVRYGGKIYICVIGHEASADFFTDFDITPPKWNLVSDGQSWKGDWTVNTSYIVDDIVAYGARLYICNTAHTSAATTALGLENDQAKWDIFAEGIDWKGNWTVDTRYKVNDMVKYGGTTYVCNTEHTSASTTVDGLELDQAKWDYFNQGIDYKSEWASATRYKNGDVIRYGSGLWICTAAHTSSAAFGTDSANWEFFVQGFQFESEWDFNAAYQQGDVVRYGGNQYIALTANSAKNPFTETGDWQLFSQGLRFMDEWGVDSSGYEYRVGEVVRNGAYTYICIADNANQRPPNATYWQRLTSGLEWRGEWLDDQEYYLGDVVRFGANTYVCVLGHISEGDDYSTATLTDPGGGNQDSRPDLDTAGVYWNILAIGKEEDVLTTKGDLVYYNTGGPARLPIGENGQVLTVGGDGVPEWAYLGDADYVYWVAEHGVNLPAPDYGRTIDRPWASIRYACEQIDKGAFRPNARKLLEMNRQFIQREIIEWTDNQISTNTSPFTSAFTYNSNFCERDMGLLVDAFVWDITHGGNSRTRKAALKYLETPAVYSGQAAETNASINYGLTVIANVLAQTDPDTNYQIANGDNSTAIVDQWKDSNLTTETGTLTLITELAQIVTDTITAGVATNVPAEIVRTNLVRVSTGRYKETLPIIVPAETAILGDELRSTNVQPKTDTNTTLTPVKDAAFSFKALERFGDIVSDVITGGAVDVTEGNTEPQVIDYPLGEADQAEGLEQLLRVARKNIDHGTGTKIEAKLPKAYELADPNDGYARDLILLNREFLQAEIVGYIADYDADLKYSKTKCKQDVGFILDAIAYDLSYGGNWQSVNAGEAYYEGTNQGTFVIDSSEKIATTGAYTYLKSLIGQVARNITVTSPYQSAVVQVNGVAGDAGAVTTTDGLMDNIITIINSGSGSVAITYPSLAGVNAELLATRTTLNNAKSTIQTNVIDFINTNFGDFKYDSAKCRRDSNLLQDNSAYDIALNTNYNAVRDGIAYRRSMSNKVLNAQLVQTIGSINYLRDQNAALLSDGTAITRNAAYFNEVTDIIQNNSPDTITWSDPGVSANKTNARIQLQNNRQFMIEEITAWLANPANGFSGLSYDVALCERDVGYIVDAVSYDVQYGGNSATYEAARAYFDGVGASTLGTGEATATAAAYARLATVMAEIVVETTVTKSPTNTATQDVSGTAASATEATEVDGLVQIIEDVITAGNVTGLPTKTFPDYSWAAAGIETDADAILADTTAVPATIQYITNTYSGFVYDHTKCSRDIGYIIDASIYDYCFGTNVASMIASYSYLRRPSAKVVGDQKEATIAANAYARQLCWEQIDNTATDVEKYWREFAYDSTKCERDVQLLVDAIRLDAIFNSNYRTVASALRYTSSVTAEVDLRQKAQTLAAFAQAKALTEAELSDATIISRANDLWDTVDFIIRNGAGGAPAYSYPTPTGGSNNASDSGYLNARNQIIANKTFIQEEIIAWIAVQVAGNIAPFTTSFEYDSVACRRDVGLIVDALIYDLTYGGNLQTYDAALAYYIGTVAQYGTGEKEETLAALARLKTIVGEIIVETTVTKSAGNDETQDTSGTAGSAAAQTAGQARIQEIYDYLDNDGDAVAAGLTQSVPDITWTSGTFQTEYAALGTTAQASIADDTSTFIATKIALAGTENTFEWVNDMIFGGAAEGSMTTVGDQRNFAAIRQLELNKDFVVAEVHAYISEYFKSTVTKTDGITEYITVDDGTYWMQPNMAVKFVSADSSLDSITNAGLVEDTTYYIKDILSKSKFTVSATPGGAIENISSETGTFFVQADYSYSVATCSRDVIAFIDAMKWDMEWPQQWKRSYTQGVTLHMASNYKTRLAARYYVNSVKGSQEEDFFYLRNGTGLRMMTLDGLRGDLGPADADGVSKPTAGAYASLDPGWGPDDERAWITARSPYMQNNSCFGYGAIGQKVDGALHNGGNDSMVSNDFTQLISDGIGAWITNNGRAELVSVFTYYSHVGYLAENGGRIRGTNGNNSYGDFGSVAIGVDPDETPTTGVVDNQSQYNATISKVDTNNTQILAVEYNHAGNEYTMAQMDFFGNGTGEVAVQDEFRDGAIFEARLLDLDDSSGSVGGDGYTVVQNTAQDGSTTSLTLAATDGSSSTAYIGMKVIITGGAGVGQYALVDTYDSGTKIATVIKESNGGAGWDHFVPGTTITAPNSSSTYQIEPAVSFTNPTRSSVDDAFHTTGTWSAGTFAQTTAQYTGISGTSSADGSLATFNIDKVGRKYYVTLASGGQYYARLETITIDGASVGGASTTHDIVITVTSVDADGTITGFDFTGAARTGLFIALNSADDNNCSKSYDGTTWTAEALPTSGAGFWCSVASGLIDDGSTFYTPSYICAVAEDVLNVAYSTDGLTWSTSSLPGTISTGGFKDIAFGSDSLGTLNRFVVVGETDLDIAYSDDGGANWTAVAGALQFASVGRTCLAYGLGKFVAIKFGSNEVNHSIDGGLTWSAGAGLPTGNWVDVAFGNGRFIALADNGNVSYSVDGTNWSSAVNIGTASGNQISYGMGTFQVTTDSQAVYWSEYGLDWTSLALSATFSTGAELAMFGNPEQTPMHIAGDAGSSTALAINTIGAKAKARVGVASEKIFEIRFIEPGSCYTGLTPTMTVTDPNNIYDINVSLRIGNGALGQPTFSNRGSGFTDASAEINNAQSNGYADIIQYGAYIAVRRLTERPVAGSNVVFDGIDTTYKLVSVVSFIGDQDGSYTAFLQVSPTIEIRDDLSNATGVTCRIRYSQVRLTGHDFLDIGTGNFTKTNYPNTPLVDPDPTKETLNSAGGRVFYTSTDQDGNFRVGDLFTIEQATGVATLNAEAFNIAGLQELSLGEVTLGGNSASITEFSTDPFFTANSDTIVPTQRAIKAYIESQIGGGGATLNVNTVTAGDVFIGSNLITTASGLPINISAVLNFTGGVRGIPLALNYMLR